MKKKNIAGIESEVLILGAISKDNSIFLLNADKNLINGLPIA